MDIRSLDIIGFPNYAINDTGRVYSLYKSTDLKPGIGNHGYYIVILSND